MLISAATALSEEQYASESADASQSVSPQHDWEPGANIISSIALRLVICQCEHQ